VTSGGTMQYSLTENGTYSQDIPTGTDAGTYTVWYRVIGDENHNDTAPPTDVLAAVHTGIVKVGGHGVVCASVQGHVVEGHAGDVRVCRANHRHSDLDGAGREELRPGAEQLPYDWQHHQGRRTYK